MMLAEALDAGQIRTTQKAKIGRPSLKVEAVCAKCGKTFVTKRSAIKNGRKYCSPACYRQVINKQVERACVVCGKRFFANQYRVKHDLAKYCSHECANVGLDTKIAKKCAWCGKDFAVRASQTKAKYCSWNCKIEARRFNRIRVCVWCKKTFLRRPLDKTHKGKFCSKKCYGAWLNGENNVRWLGGISFEPYCPKFNDEFKERVRAFFGNECVICGKTEAELGRKLSVHHVNYDKMTCCNETIPRFAAVCNRHNLIANRNRDRWEYIFNYIIDEFYNGKCYFTREEFYEPAH